MIHLRAGQGTHHIMSDGDHVAKTVVRDAEGAFEVFEVLAPAAPAAPAHVSPWSGVLLVVEGRVRAVVAETTVEADPGDLVVFPAGTPCTFEVVGEAARFWAVTTGEGAGRFFADFAATVPIGEPGEETMRAIAGVTQRHGVTLAP